MFLIILWALIGLGVGGMLGAAAGDAGANHPGDIGAIFGGLVPGAAFGAAGGGFFGRWLSQKFAAEKRKRELATVASLLVIPVLGLGGWLFEAVRTWDDLTPSGGAAKLHYEVSLPMGTPAPAEEAIVAELRTEKEIRKQSFAGHGVYVERVGNRVVIKGNFETYKTAQKRVLRLRIGDGPTHVFVLKLLPPRPPSGYSKGYSEWHGAEQVEEADKPPRPPLPNENLEFRYQMDVI